jgi:hypothetical protein
MPRLVCLADTHGQHGRLTGPFAVPDGDVLVFAGDACTSGTPGEWAALCRWLGALPHAHKLVVAGNHDWPLQHARPDWGVSARYGPTTIYTARERVRDAGAVLLEDSGLEASGLSFWGSPWVPFFNHWAFNLPRGGPHLAEAWSRIPPGTDVLVTHGAAFGGLDLTGGGDHVGCEVLTERLRQLDASGAGPRLHVHGDIHEAAGVVGPPLGASGRITVNATVLDGGYRLARPPVVIDL